MDAVARLLFLSVYCLLCFILGRAEAIKEPMKILTDCVLMMDEVMEAFKSCSFVIEDLQGRPLNAEDAERIGIDLDGRLMRMGVAYALS